MALSLLQLPPKTEENRKVANVCVVCRKKDLSAGLAVDKLGNGIVHLAIDQLAEAQQKGGSLTKEHINLLWGKLINLACVKNSGCAQSLRYHIWCDELEDFWATTSVEMPVGRLHAHNRRSKKQKARKKQAAVAAPTGDRPQPFAPAPPAEPVETTFGLPIALMTTIASHPKPAKK